MTTNFDEKRSDPNSDEALIDRAASWYVRFDRGLSSQEEAEFNKLIQEDPAFAKEYEKFERTRSFTRKLPPDIARDLLAETEESTHWYRPWMAAAAMVALLLGGFSLVRWAPWASSDSDLSFEKALIASTHPTTHVFPDGSLVRLNVDSEVAISYSGQVRKAHLLKGEAHFTVEEDPLRPFLVLVNQIQIEAVGTAFNVRRSEGVDVIVTEGIVRIAETGGSVAPIPAPIDTLKNDLENLVIQGQRAEIVLPTESDAFAFEVFTVDHEEVEEELEWRSSLLTITGENLVEIAANFERQTGYRLEITDPSLGELQFAGRFPSDDVPGFLRILRDFYGIYWQEKEEGVYVLGGASK